jgi:hypothetical protein
MLKLFDYLYKNIHNILGKHMNKFEIYLVNEKNTPKNFLNSVTLSAFVV